MSARSQGGDGQRGGRKIRRKGSQSGTIQRAVSPVSCSISHFREWFPGDAGKARRPQVVEQGLETPSLLPGHGGGVERAVAEGHQGLGRHDRFLDCMRKELVEMGGGYHCWIDCPCTADTATSRISCWPLEVY